MTHFKWSGYADIVSKLIDNGCSYSQTIAKNNLFGHKYIQEE